MCPCYSEVESLLQKVNEETERQTSQYSFEKLSRHDFDVFPDTAAVNFYNSLVERKGYSPQVQFQQQASKIVGKTIKMSEFFNGTADQGTRYVAVVGGVGYGKTVMLKRFANDALNKKPQALKEVEYVRFISLMDVADNDKVTSADVLFKEIPGYSADVRTCAVKYIFQNPRKFLLVLDGIDQFPNQLGVTPPLRNFESEGSTRSILSSLCSGHLLPGMRVLVSSREHAIRHFTDQMRPDKVIALSGLSLESIEKLVRKFGGTKHNDIWVRLQKQSPSLLSLSSIPMFLVFTVTVLSDGKRNPETSTELFMHVLNHHITSAHVTGNIVPVISKLKPMSFDGLENGKITFTIQDLPCDVSIDKARDLLIALPGVNARNQKLFDGHFRLNFCHQSIQEALAALYVAEMPLERFRQFVSYKIHLPKWVIVRRMVSGILFHSKTREAAKGNDPAIALLKLICGKFLSVLFYYSKSVHILFQQLSP